MAWLAGALIVLALLWVTGAKGLWRNESLWAGLVLTVPLIVVIPFRLARPGSWWARRFYTGEKLERARRRYPTDAEEAERTRAELDAAWGDSDVDPELMDRTTRRALKRAGKLS